MKAWWIVPVLSLVPAVAVAQNDPNQPSPGEQTMPAQQVGAQPQQPPPAQPAQQPVYYQQQPPPPGYQQQPPPPGYGQPTYYQPPPPQPVYAQPVYYQPVAVRPRRSHGLEVGGAIMFAVPYAISLLAAVICSGNSSCAPGMPWLYAPGIGPFLVLTQPRVSADGAAVLVIDGLLQSAGLAMLIGGIARGSGGGAYGANSDHDSHAFSWAVLPGAAGAPIGATFVATSF